MTLNFIQLNNFLISSVFLLFFTNLYNTSIGNCSNLDLLLRYQPNDLVSNVLYLFWTNTWYLYILLTFLVTWNLLLNTKLFKSFSLSSLVFILLTLFSLEFFIYWNLNDFLNVSSLFQRSFNQLLTNSINKYHPLLFYISLVTVLKIILLNISKLTYISLSKYRLGSFLTTTYKDYYYLILLFITLYFGSWWALQEGSWGGWWNWDPSEVFGLLTAYFLLLLTHMVYINFQKYQNSENYYILAVLILSTYLFIQLNFRLVSHNFGTKVVWFIDTDQFNLLCSLLSLWVTFLLLYRIRKNLMQKLISSWNYKTINQIQLFNKTYVYSVFYALLVIQMLLSFTILLNDFFWKFLKVNVLNSTSVISINWSIILIIIIVLTLLHSRVWTKVYIIGLLFWTNSFLTYFSSLTLNVSFINLQHLYLLLLISLSYLSSFYVNSTWLRVDTVLQSPINPILNSDTIEYYTTSVKNSLCKDSNFNFINVYETSESLKSFYLQVNDLGIQQELITGIHNNLFLINVDDYITTNLNIIFLVILFSVYFILIKHKKILF